MGEIIASEVLAIKPKDVWFLPTSLVHCSRISHNSFTFYQPTCVSDGKLPLVFLFLTFHLDWQSRPLCRNYSMRFAAQALKHFLLLLFFTFYFVLLLKRARGSSNIIICTFYRQINPLHASVYKHPYNMYGDFVYQAGFIQRRFKHHVCDQGSHLVKRFISP